jgi:hypothetical protein
MTNGSRKNIYFKPMKIAFHHSLLKKHRAVSLLLAFALPVSGIFLHFSQAQTAAPASFISRRNNKCFNSLEGAFFSECVAVVVVGGDGNGGGGGSDDGGCCRSGGGGNDCGGGDGWWQWRWRVLSQWRRWWWWWWWWVLS